jgi:cytochrome-b5 reductase
MPKSVEDGIQRVIAYERDFVPVKLVQKQQLTASTSLFVFELPEKAELLMFPGHHVTLRRVTKHKQVICRPYTPVTELVRYFGGKDSNNATMQSLNVAGTVAIAVKKYKDGAMSEWLHESLRIGDTVDLMGPSGGFYCSPNQHATISLIAGGTGITPILSVILAVLKNHSDNTTMKLVYVNSMEQDVMFRDELNTLAQLYPNKLSLVYLAGSGCITREVLSTNLPGPSDQHLVAICGPTGFCTTVQTTLAKLKYEEHTLFTFGETDK